MSEDEEEDEDADRLTASDEIEQAIAQCGVVDHGPCAHAGSEYCQYRCDFNNERKAKE
jgi:hypothetical protein